MIDIEDLKRRDCVRDGELRLGQLVSKKQEAIKYYEGELPEKPETVGRSGVVSSDVADSIEWLLPSIVESLRPAKAVRFMPMSQMDEDQCALERS